MGENCLRLHEVQIKTKPATLHSDAAETQVMGREKPTCRLPEPTAVEQIWGDAFQLL